MQASAPSDSAMSLPKTAQSHLRLVINFAGFRQFPAAISEKRFQFANGVSLFYRRFATMQEFQLPDRVATR